MFKQIAALVTLIVILSCNSSDRPGAQMSDINVATAFIRDLLDNKLADAEKYILKDEENQQYFDAFKKQYSSKSPAELEKYRSADIIINETSYVTDTVCIVNYSNTANREVKNKVKVVKIDGKWVIDLKYTFSGNL